jgi:hypothetical protein
MSLTLTVVHPNVTPLALLAIQNLQYSFLG